MRTSEANGDIPYWSQDAEELAAFLSSSPSGLSSECARGRLIQSGSNLVEGAPENVLRMLLRQLENPLVLILVFAAIITLFLQDWLDATIILTIVICSCLLSFFQEYRASAALNELKKRFALSCRVIRNSREQKVPANTIVPGDIVLLSAGSLIPADGVVIDSTDFLVSEASITGESFPVEKRREIIRPDAPITQRSNTVFLGSSVRSGTAKILAVKRETKPNLAQLQPISEASNPKLISLAGYVSSVIC